MWGMTMECLGNSPIPACDYSICLMTQILMEKSIKNKPHYKRSKYAG